MIFNDNKSELNKKYNNGDMLLYICTKSQLKGSIQKLFNEASSDSAPVDTGKASGAKDAVNVMAVTKTVETLRKALPKFVKLDEAQYRKIIDMSKKNYEIAKTIAEARGEKSKKLDEYAAMIKTAEGTKGYSKKIADPAYTAGSLILISIALFLVECGAIIAEATVEISKGTDISYDKYVNSHKAYKNIFEMWDVFITNFDSGIAKTLFAAANAPADPEAMSRAMLMGITEVYGEASTTPMLRIIKALAFKGFYILLSPIRYIIYLLLFAGYTVADRISQIGDLIALYDKDSHRMSDEKLQSMADTSSKTVIDRIDAEAKAYKQIEIDRTETAKEINNSVSY